MNAFEYNPFADALTVSYVCPNCNKKNNEFVAVPAPDLTAENDRGSINSESIDIQCEHCGKDFCIDLSTGYNGGNGVIHGVEMIIGIEEDFSDEDDYA